MGPLWREVLSTFSSEEIVELQRSNRVWNKELRGQTTTLINSRLAKQIGAEEYSTGRKACNESLEECTRRGRVLLEEMSNRAYHLRRAARSHLHE
jgi:hypothetical protein